MAATTESSTLLPRDDGLANDAPAGLGMKNRLLVGCLAAACFVGFGWVLGSDTSMHQLSAARDADLPPFLGSSKNKKDKHDKKKKKDGNNDAAHQCDDGGYSKRTLKLAYELPFASLFRDTKGQKKYEASSVIVVDDNAYAVCDSSWAISKFGSQLQPFAAGNIQIGDPSRELDDSGYEALLHEDGVFYVVRESILHEDETYHAIIEELVLGGGDYSIGQICTCEFGFEGDSKGFEGAVAVHDLNNEMVVLGLCEGNYCSELHKNDKGNGRMVAMRREMLADGSCQWKTIRMIEIPSSAYFRDYSAIALSEDGRAAISSQEESQIWLGKLLGQQPGGLWDIDAMEFSTEDVQVYDFPKNDQCQTVYCNIEGIHWINEEMVMAVSDKMKSKGKQDFRCFEKDQSVHVFVLPK